MEEIIEITAVAHGGYGVARIRGQVCFVPYGLPGDTLRAAVTRRSKGVLWAAIVERLTASPHYIEPPCPYFGQCGGCTWLHFGYPGQKEWKCRIVGDCLSRIAGLAVAPHWAGDGHLQVGYRTRAEFHGDGQRLGYFALGSRRIVDIERCPLCHERLNEALGRLRRVGCKGSVELCVNPEGDEVLAWAKYPQPHIKNVFPLTNSAYDRNCRPSFQCDGIPIVNGAFSQSSLLLNRLLRGTVHEALGSAESLLDLYCGSGNFSLGLTGRVLGIDHHRAAVDAAAKIRPGAYRTGGEDAFREALRSGAWDVVLVDPPRTGAKAILADLAAAKAKTILYVSCDPATLARDVKALVAHNWRIAAVTLVDMFPNTYHVETLCRLERAPTTSTPRAI